MITAREIMNSSYQSLHPALSILEAFSRFQKTSNDEGRRIFGMMVIDDNKELVGILSMYDILTFLQPKHVHIWGEMSDIDVSGLLDTLCRKSREIFVGDIMSTDITTVDADTHLFGVLELMNRKHIRRLPVTEDNQVIGIVYISDLFFYLVERLQAGTPCRE